MIKIGKYIIDSDNMNFIIKKTKIIKDSAKLKNKDNLGKSYDYTLAYYSITGGLQPVLEHIINLVVADGIILDNSIEEIIHSCNEYIKFLKENIEDINKLQKEVFIDYSKNINSKSKLKNITNC